MKPAHELAIRNVEIEGRTLDVLVDRGAIVDIGMGLPPAREEFDGRKGALIPGLSDHHIHLAALASQANSVVLDDVRTQAEFVARIKSAIATSPSGAWIRGTGYHESAVGELTRRELDVIAPRNPVRIQHQSGVLWILNSFALAGAMNDGAACVERDAGGHVTGRIWRGDSWLREWVPVETPRLCPVGRQLASFGITAVTDTSATNDAAAVEMFAANVREGAFPQRLTLMSAGELDTTEGRSFSVGAVKVLLDDHELPTLEEFIARISQARSWNRPVAVHCVTATQLALTLAAFEAAPTASGDRIEHGSIIPSEALAALHKAALTVVTQPGFVYARGDRYMADVDPQEQADLYRCKSLMDAQVCVAAGSDAPYGPVDPWLAIRTAVSRRTRSGKLLGEAERIAPTAALRLFTGETAQPGSSQRKIAKGARADLCLLKVPLREALNEPSAQLVRATFVDGRKIYDAA